MKSIKIFICFHLYTIANLGAVKTTNVRRMQRESEMRSAVSSWVKESERSSWERSRNRAVAMLPATTVRIMVTQFIIRQYEIFHFHSISSPVTPMHPTTGNAIPSSQNLKTFESTWGVHNLIFMLLDVDCKGVDLKCVYIDKADGERSLFKMFWLMQI